MVVFLCFGFSNVKFLFCVTKLLPKSFFNVKYSLILVKENINH